MYLSSNSYNKKISKIDNKFIEYKPSPNLLDCLIKYGFRKIFLLIAYKSQSIIREIGDFYKGVPITYIKDNKELKAGTASALLNAIKI